MENYKRIKTNAMRNLWIVTVTLTLVFLLQPLALALNTNAEDTDLTITNYVIESDRHYLDSLWHNQYPDFSFVTADSSLLDNNISGDYSIDSPNIQTAFIPNSVEINVSNSVGEIPIKSKVTDTGAKSYEVPISVYPGMNGLQPELSIVYNSQYGNGILGYGWSISGISSINCTRKSFFMMDLLVELRLILMMHSC